MVIVAIRRHGSLLSRVDFNAKRGTCMILTAVKDSSSDFTIFPSYWNMIFLGETNQPYGKTISRMLHRFLAAMTALPQDQRGPFPTSQILRSCPVLLRMHVSLVATSLRI
jgi:hypothetical protein